MKRNTWKKTIAFVLAFTLVAGTLPANVGGFLTGGTEIVAKAAYRLGDLKIEGGTVNGSVNNTTWEFNKDNTTLTLNGANFTGSDDSYKAIDYSGTDKLTIVLVGENKIDFSEGGSYGIRSSAPIEITGTGSLTIIGNPGYGADESGIFMKDTNSDHGGDITISEGATVDISGAFIGIFCSNSNSDINVNGSTLNAQGKGYGISWSGNVIIDNKSSVTAIGNTQAIDGVVKNAVPGKGWTNAAGTGDAADIEIDSNKQFFSYKKVQFAPPAAPTPVPYMDWNGTSLVEKTGDNACKEYTPVTSSTSTSWSAGWYVVSGEVTISDRITVNGEVNLILKDGAKLTAQDGIYVPGNATLNIYAQSEGESCGQLIANPPNGGPGIGGNSLSAAGNITINGGKVEATGGTRAAGIGGGFYGAGGTVTINGGTVTATGGEKYDDNNRGAAGIGGGQRGNGGTVTINGGTVTAIGTDGGAGIGGGEKGAGGNVTISGGTVTANGGAGGAGIGGGSDASDNGALTLTGVILSVSSDNTSWSYTTNTETRPQYMKTNPAPTVTFTEDTLTYDGNAKQIITGVDYGDKSKLWLRVNKGSSTDYNWVRADSALTSDKLKATDAGEYKVYYYLGDSEPDNSATPAGEVSGSVTIAKADFTVTTAPTAIANLKYTGNEQELINKGVAANGTLEYGVATEPVEVIEKGNGYTLQGTDLTVGKIFKPSDYDGFNFPTGKSVKLLNYDRVIAPATSAGTPGHVNVYFYDGSASILGGILESFPDGCDALRIDKINDDSIEVTAVKSSECFEVKTWSTTPPKGTNAGEYNVCYRVKGNDNYNDIAQTKINNVKIGKADLTVTDPTANQLTYTGGAQYLVTAGSVADNKGTMKYAVTESYVDAAPTDDNSWSETVPQRTDVDTYKVWYKAIPTDTANYNEYVNSVTVSIGKATPTITPATGLTYDGDAKKLIDRVSYAGGTNLYLCVKNANDTSYSFDWVRYNEANDLTNDKLKATAAGTYYVYYYNDKIEPSTTTEGTLVDSVTISNGTLSISAQGYTGTYDGTAHGITLTGVPTGATVKYCLTESGDYTADPITFTNATDGAQTVYYKVEKANYNTVSGSATVNISKAALNVIAKPKTITYGDAPTNDGVEYSGFVTGDNASKLGGTLDYDYSYTQYGNIGTYSITPKGLTSGNYNISFVAGTLTVQAKTIGINWTNTTFTYNGESHIPTASATGTVNNDEIGITVIGGQTNASNTAYSATASAITGTKAGNYKLPAANTKSFTISKANPTANAPTGLTATYEQTLADVIMTNPTGNTAGSWAWNNDALSVGDVGNNQFTATFTPTDHDNYNTLDDISVTITVGKAVPTYDAPVLQGTRLTHYSSDLLLIKTAGSVTVGQGTMSYALTEVDEAPAADAVGTWKTDISDIKATKADTYYVWYKITGADNYELAPTQLGSVTVSQYSAPSYYSQTWTLTMDSYEYDGTAHTPTINGTPHTYSNTQVRYTYYNTDTNEELDGAPSAVGNYKVKVYADGGSNYYSRTQYATYSITDPIDVNGMAKVDAFKENDTVPVSDGKIFAGWFTDETCTTAYTEDTGKAYAKFIDEKILTVKAQISSGTTANSEKTSIRFITSVDSLKYQNVGFKITFNGKTIDKQMTKVYTALNANGKKISPKVFSEDSNYMEAYTLNNIPQSAFGKEFTVTPYYTTQDGTIVEGATNTFTIANMIK